VTGDVHVELSVSAPLADSAGAMRDETVAVLVAARAAVGLPDRDVAVVLRDETRMLPDEVARLGIDGRSVSLLARDVSAAAASAVPGGVQPAGHESARSWLAGLDRDTRGRALRHVLTAVVERSTDLLVAPGDAGAVWSRCEPAPGEDLDALLPELLRRGGDLTRLPDGDPAVGTAGPSAGQVAERLLDSVGVDRLVVRGSARQVRSVTGCLDGTIGLAQLRAEFLAAFGVPVPAIDVVTDESVPDGQLQLALGPVTAPPAPAPPADAEAVVYLLARHLSRRAERLARPAAMAAVCEALFPIRPRLVEEVRTSWTVHELSAVTSAMVRRTRGVSPLALFGGLADVATGWRIEPVHSVLRELCAEHTLALTESVDVGTARVLDVDRAVQEAQNDLLAEAYLAVPEDGRARVPLLVDDDLHAPIQDMFRTRFPGVDVLARIDIPRGVRVRRVTRLQAPTGSGAG
jgi:hypothetical protein